MKMPCSTERRVVRETGAAGGLSASAGQHGWKSDPPALVEGRPWHPAPRAQLLSLAGLALLVSLALGCTSGRLMGPASVDCGNAVQQRRQQCAREFEESRDAAELHSAEASWQRGDAQGCEESLRRLLQRNPNYRDARLLLAEVYFALQRKTEAWEEINQAAQAHPNDPQVQYATGLALQMSNRGDEALAYYEQAAKAEPDNEVYTAAYQIALEAAQRGEATSRGTAQPAGPGDSSAGNAAKTAAGSLDVADKLLAAGNPPGARLERPSPTAASTDGPAIGSPGTDPFLAAPCSPEPRSPVTAPEPARRAGAAGSAGRAGAAETAGGPQSEALLRRADVALGEGAPQAALEFFHQAESLDTHNPQILISAAAIALRHNQPDVAVALLQPAEKRFASSAGLHRILGAAYYRLGDYESSQVALQQALSLDKSSALSYFLMGCTLLRLGQHGQAEAHFRQAEALDPCYTVRR